MSVPPPAPPVSQTPDEAACLRVLREQPFRWYGWRGTLVSAVVATVVAWWLWRLLPWGPISIGTITTPAVTIAIIDAARTVGTQRAARRADRLVPLRVRSRCRRAPCDRCHRAAQGRRSWPFCRRGRRSAGP